MKTDKISLLLIFVFISSASFAQVGIGTTTPDNSAALDVKSTDKGFLPPRMTEADRNAITTPATGLIVWCSNCGSDGEVQVFNGTTWTNMIGGVAAAKPLEIGDNYQGGKIAYILQLGDPGYDANVQHGIIAAPSDQSTGAQWGCYGTLIAGADGIALGTGAQNTIDIESGCTTAGTAADICANLTLGGYSDWYLPSKDELNKLYINKTAVGGFAIAYYWSSTEYSNTNAWLQNIANGSQYYVANKYDAGRVRAVRAF